MCHNPPNHAAEPIIIRGFVPPPRPDGLHDYACVLLGVCAPAAVLLEVILAVWG